MSKLAEQVLLISGASSGLGAACTERCLNQGARVIGMDLAATGIPVATSSANYLHAQGSVTDATAVAQAISQGIARFGKLTGAICCAGILHAERVVGRDGPSNL